MNKKKKKKNNSKKTYKKEIRIIKAKQWLITYEGSQRHIVRNYKKLFRVDIITAAKELQELGVVFSKEYLIDMEISEKSRIMKRAKDKEEKKQRELEENYCDSDDTFSFIAGYTSGGAPFGITWEDLDLEPYASNEEIEEKYSKF